MASKLSKSEIEKIESFNKSIIRHQYETIQAAKKSRRGGMAYLISHEICILRKGDKDEWWFRLPKEFQYRMGMQYQEIHEWLIKNNKPCSAEVFYNQFLNPKRFSRELVVSED